MPGETVFTNCGIINSEQETCINAVFSGEDKYIFTVVYVRPFEGISTFLNNERILNYQIEKNEHIPFH